jgi:hypothetical protein
VSVYLIPSFERSLAQGDIFVNVPYWRPHRRTFEHPWPDVNSRGGFPMHHMLYDHAVIVTQTCDMPHAKDYLFVVCETAEQVVRTLTEGQSSPFTEEEFRKWIVSNLHPRYHFLEQFENNGSFLIPELVANFRRVFTLRAEYVREKLLPEQHRVLSMHDIYGAELGNRFGHFFSRVATERNMISS